MGERRSQSAGYYIGLFNTVEVLEDTEEYPFTTLLNKAVETILKNKDRYMKGVEGTKVPWYFVALLHHMESDCNFKCQIANGERWYNVTTIVPKGIGPWTCWEESTTAILKMDNIDKVPQWTISGILRMLENYNGTGYCKRGKNSPYLWSGCNHGVGTGKYVEDGHYDANAVSKQIGAGVVLAELLRRREI